MHGFMKLSLVGALLLSVYAAPAQAQLDVYCPGTIVQTWTPGAQVFPRELDYTVSIVYDPCSTSVPSITTGRIEARLRITDGCIPGATPQEATIIWSDGSRSTFTYQPVKVDTAGAAQVYTNIGQVISGRFKGAEASFTNTMVNTNPLACLSPEGLRRLAGSSVLVFTRLPAR